MIKIPKFSLRQYLTLGAIVGAFCFPALAPIFSTVSGALTNSTFESEQLNVSTDGQILRWGCSRQP